MSVKNKLLFTAVCSLAMTSLQGCSVLEWTFGGPDLEDMTEIRAHMPPPSNQSGTFADVQLADPHQYPTEWHRGQLLD